jgi:hypothetical protein
MCLRDRFLRAWSKLVIAKILAEGLSVMQVHLGY